MSDPFASSRRKIAWAKKNIPKLNSITKEFVKQENLYTILKEPDPHNPQHTVHKMRLLKQIPDGLSELTGNIVDDLRAALDHALFGIARIHKPGMPAHLLNASFPFAGDVDHFENNLRGRCKDVPIELWPLLRSYEPYKGGSEMLLALNEVCGANKHGLLIAVGTAGVTTQTVVEGTGFWSMPNRPVWDRTKQEMELFTAGPQPKLHAKFTVGFYVAFGEIDGLTGKATIPLLDDFATMVETIVNEIEAEAMRLGIVKP
jgi:hypothetical protein